MQKPGGISSFAKIDRKFEKRSVILAFVPTINLIISTHY